MEEKLLEAFKPIGINNKRDELSLEFMKISYLLKQELNKVEGIDEVPIAFDYDPDKDFVKSESEMLDIFYMDAIRIENALQTLIEILNNK